MAELASNPMNSPIELEAPVWRESRASRDASLDQRAQPSIRSEHDVSPAPLAIATIWWALLAYAAGQSLLH
jgi:hypothetical protein